MEKIEKKKNIPLKILKVFAIVILCIAIVFVGGYLYIKYYLGFDIGKFKHAIDLLNKNYVSSNVITNTYNNENSINGFDKLFGSSEMYVEENGKYALNKESFESASLQNTTTLTDKELAGIINAYVNCYNKTDLEYFGENLTLKQIIFSNLIEQGDFYSITLTYTFQFDLYEQSKDLNQLSSFFLNLIPEKILITSCINLNISKTDCFDFSFTNSKFLINNLSEKETDEVLSILENFKLIKNEIINEIDSSFISSIFGGDSITGFVNRINACNGFEFINEDSQIKLQIKKY